MPKAITDFQKKVYNAVKRIPRGKVATYKIIAEAIGCRSAQAVGQALKKNPFAPEVPCHRVIGSDLKIGGFGGKTTGKKIREKINLLAEEGVKFKNGKLIDKNLILKNFYN